MTIQKFYAAKTEPVGERQARVICSTGDVDRAGDVVVQDGIDLSAYKMNPIVLWGHDTSQPIAKAVEIGIVEGKLMATVEFPPAGISAKADEICGLVKSGVISAVSIGFNPTEMEPIDKSNPKKGPQKYLKCELGEFSFVSVPANKSALTVERQNSAPTAVWKVGASRNLPVQKAAAADRELVVQSILDLAEFGSDHPNQNFARKGFLVYDADDAGSDSAYRIPFADVVDGRLSVTAAGIAAAKSLLLESDLPTDVAAKARAVLEHYEAKMAGTVTVTKDQAPLKIKDLYDVASLAYALNSLGYLQSNAAWEAEYEGDGSQVPQMIADACRTLADALVAMTTEEVSELLTQMTPAGEEAVAKGFCKKNARPLAKAMAAVKIKAGAKFSKTTKSAMAEACKSIMSGHDAISTLLDESSDDEGDDTVSMSDTDKSAEELRQKRFRDLDLLRLSAV
jgi:HK97 family phage prohead protease